MINKTTMDQETKAALIHKYYAGETTAEEEMLLEKHFASTGDPSVGATGAIFRYATARKTDMPPPALAEKLISIPLAERSPYRYAWRAAAALAVMIGAVWLALHFLGFRQIRIEAKELSDTILPDGTHVWMNAGSTVVYAQAISSDLREVTLEGEAYFEVAKDDERPRFIIHTGQATTTVTGTAFNLRNIDSEKFVELSVLSGTVLFGQTNFKQVNAGMQALFDKQTASPQTRPMQTANSTAWKDRKLSFTNASLAEVIHDIERYFQTDVELKNPKAASCHLTGEFINPQIEDVLDVIAETLNGSQHIENNTYHLTVPPCDL
jgi:transmembrane sensor